MATKEGPNSEDDSYMGYSVETITYHDTGISGAVVGVPRGHGLNGKVKKKNYRILTRRITAMVPIIVPTWFFSLDFIHDVEFDDYQEHNRRAIRRVFRLFVSRGRR